MMYQNRINEELYATDYKPEFFCLNVIFEEQVIFTSLAVHCPFSFFPSLCSSSSFPVWQHTKSKMSHIAHFEYFPCDAVPQM